jgi:hypothetical protein
MSAKRETCLVDLDTGLITDCHRIRELEARLEWRSDGHDGIYCRDQTIAALEAEVARLRQVHMDSIAIATQLNAKLEAAEAKVANMKNYIEYVDGVVAIFKKMRMGLQAAMSDDAEIVRTESAADFLASIKEIAIAPAAEDRAAGLETDRDSWRRTAERCETEKQAAEAKVARISPYLRHHDRCARNSFPTKINEFESQRRACDCGLDAVMSDKEE